MNVASSILRNFDQFCVSADPVIGSTLFLLVKPLHTSGERWVSQEVVQDDHKCLWYMLSAECHGMYTYYAGQ